MAKKIELLVSPRNVDEAKIVVENGVKYIDCKNPMEGSLGANFPWIIKKMKNLIPNNKIQLLSATIGDFPNLAGSASLAALGAAVSGADIIKVGLKGPKNEEQGTFLMSNVVKAVKSYNPKIKVVVAGYADRSVSRKSPNYLDIPEIAFNSGSDIAMLDTYIKNGRGLFDFLSITQLLKFKEKANDLNIKVALAGNIMMKDLYAIKEISPEILGVRSVVCDGHDRIEGTIKRELINNLKIELSL